MPRVSVIMSVFNESESDIKNSINSILNQTYSEFEFIIILDNPKNKILGHIIQGYANIDSRIKFFINKANIGLAESLNKGIKLSSGELICRMDADDISFNNRLELQVKKFDEDENLDLLSGSIVKIDEDGNILEKCIYRIDSKKLNKILVKSNFIVHPTVMFKKNKIKKIGCYRNLPTAQDLDLWLRCVSKNYKIKTMEETLLFYRIRKNSITSTKAFQQWLTHEYVLELHKQRLKNGVDSYSEHDYSEFLKQRNFNNIQNEKFNNGLKLISTIKKLINQKKFIKAIFYLNKLLCSQKEIIKYLIYIKRLSIIQNKK